METTTSLVDWTDFDASAMRWRVASVLGTNLRIRRSRRLLLSGLQQTDPTGVSKGFDPLQA